MASELKGAREFSMYLNAMGKKISGRVLRKAVKTAGQLVVNEAIPNVPVGEQRDGQDFQKETYKGRLVWHPGFAQKNVRQKPFVSRDRKKAGTLIGVAPEAFYAINFVEMGASRQAAQPWLRPAFAAKKSEMLSVLTKTMGDEIKKLKAKAARVK